ncbi:MAG: cysteine desulfurase family protein [Devosia sp.]
MRRLYLDWNATAPVVPAARAAAVAALSVPGNASSVHAEGRASRALVERARRSLAARFNVPADQVTFTSGGTEANMTALSPGIARTGEVGVQRLIISEVEHPAVRSGGRFSPDDVAVAPVDTNGLLDPAALKDLLEADERPALVSVMAANNETGVLQPLCDIAALCQAHGAILHTDAVQAFGRVADAALTADLVTLSGHKIGAPAGVGALIRLTPLAVPPLVLGGGQERGARGGTENVAAIAGFGAALDGQAADPAAWEETRAARDGFEVALIDAFDDAIVFGKGVPRLPNTSLFSVGTLPAELLIIGLDLEGMAVSSGAACSSGKVGLSPVLLAMGVEEAVASRAIRVSVGPAGAQAAFERFLVALRKVIVPSDRCTRS